MITQADDPPLRIKICWIVLIALLFPLMVAAPNYADYSSERWVVIEENSFLGAAPVGTPRVRVLTSLVGENLAAKLDRIGKCECNGDPQVCNLKYGCIAGMGRYGIISGTWNGTLDRMKKELSSYLPSRCDKKVSWQEQDRIPKEQRIHPIFDEECSRIVAMWLLKTDGDGHWEQSRACWAK